MEWQEIDSEGLLMDYKQQGFTLPEMLITLVVSSIVLGAAFGSYTIIARNFEFQKDVKYMAQSARTIVDLINKDVRMAGYQAENTAAITNAITIINCQQTACLNNNPNDEIEIIYDLSATERIQVRYFTREEPPNTATTDRYRLMKRIRRAYYHVAVQALHIS